MLEFWDRELTTEEEDVLLDEAAAVIVKRRMEAPAIIALELHKPLGNVGANAALAFSPFLVPFMGFDRVNRYSMLMRNPRNIELLIQRLEASKPRKGSGPETAPEAS